MKLLLVISFLMLADLQVSYARSPTANGQPPTVIRQPPTANRQPSTVNRQPPTSFSRSAFYKAMQLDDKALVNAQLTDVQSAPPEVKDAFTGALLMKKAGIGGSPTTKLSLFKQGHKLLEAAIKKNPDNAEFRFLRLMIQEHAPGILGYKNDLEKDSAYINKLYKTLPDELQATIADYSKKSKVLKLQVS